jgi:hypothetical protein
MSTSRSGMCTVGCFIPNSRIGGQRLSSISNASGWTGRPEIRTADFHTSLAVSPCMTTSWSGVGPPRRWLPHRGGHFFCPSNRGARISPVSVGRRGQTLQLRLRCCAPTQAWQVASHASTWPRDDFCRSTPTTPIVACDVERFPDICANSLLLLGFLFGISPVQRCRREQAVKGLPWYQPQAAHLHRGQDPVGNPAPHRPHGGS